MTSSRENDLTLARNINFCINSSYNNNNFNVSKLSVSHELAYTYANNINHSVTFKKRNISLNSNATNNLFSNGNSLLKPADYGRTASMQEDQTSKSDRMRLLSANYNNFKRISTIKENNSNVYKSPSNIESLFSKKKSISPQGVNKYLDEKGKNSYFTPSKSQFIDPKNERRKSFFPPSTENEETRKKNIENKTPNFENFYNKLNDRMMLHEIFETDKNYIMNNLKNYLIIEQQSYKKGAHKGLKKLDNMLSLIIKSNCMNN